MSLGEVGPSAAPELVPIRVPERNRSGSYKLRIRSADGRSHRLRVVWRNRPGLRIDPGVQEVYVTPRSLDRLRVAVWPLRAGDHALSVDLYLMEGKERYWGRDALGTPAAGGIYFYQIQAGRFRQIRRMMLSK